MQYSGKLIVFDGIDGTGKSTQARLLFEVLEKAGLQPVLSKEPTNGKWGTIIRQSATSKRLPIEQELQYFINDRSEHIQQLIKPSLDAGRVVILDRYYYSTIAYQGARSLDIDHIRKMTLTDVIKPDIAFIFISDISKSHDRIQNIRGSKLDLFEAADTLKKVQKNFLELCKSESEIIQIQADDSIKNVHKIILSKLPFATSLS
jgi:dTMP kinase